MVSSVRFVMATRPKCYGETIEEMERQGYVTHARLARLWGISGSALTEHIRRGHAVDRLWDQRARSWFYSLSMPKPELIPTSKRAVREEKDDVLRGGPYRGDTTSPSTEQVRLESSWAMWRAPGFVKSSKKGLRRNYRISGRMSLGWFGGAA